MSPIVCVVVAAGLVYASGRAEPHAAPSPKTVLAAGVLSQSNSKNGSAILTATGMRPTSSVTGTVTIANTGSLAGAYTLSKSQLTDIVGPNGGALSSVLTLKVEDITGAPRTIYSGRLAAMPAQRLGYFARGESRVYRFTVTFPDGGFPGGPRIGDNSFRGSAATVRYDWTATAQAGARLLIRLRGVSATLRSGVIALSAGCPAVACRVRAGGTIVVPGVSKAVRLRTVTARALARKTVKLRVKIPKRAKPAIRAALAKHKRVNAKLVVRASDASGRTASVKRTVRIQP